MARAHQKHATPASETPSARPASQRFVANSDEARPSTSQSASSSSARDSDSRRARAMHSRAAMPAVTLRSTSFGTKKRSSSKVLYGTAASTTAIAPTCRTRAARRRSASGMRRMAGGFALVAEPVLLHRHEHPAIPVLQQRKPDEAKG